MTWKNNPALQFAVVTGCLLIAKESIFTGANNFISNSISGERYKDYFGFSESEVKKLLTEADCPEHFEELKSWYDGYLFAEREIYCPWDVINHVNLTCDVAHSSENNLWSILYLTGYLTKASSEHLPAQADTAAQTTALRIPNKEVKSIFAETIAKWFIEKIQISDNIEKVF